MCLIALCDVAVRASQTEIRTTCVAAERSRYYMVDMICLSNEDLWSVAILTSTSCACSYAGRHCGRQIPTHRRDFSGFVATLLLD